MKRTFTLFLFSFLFILSASSQAGDDLFDASRIHTIRINFYEPNFWDTLEYNYDLIHDFDGLPTGPKIYLPASITIDGTTLDTVGVRQKGFFSNWGANFTGSTKKPLKVDINEFVKGQKYDGLKKFNLNNAFEDPSLMRDMLSLNLMREAGIPAPRTAYANVYLNQTYWGLYILIEQVDKTFLKQNFSNDDGNLYKSIASTDLKWYGPDPLDYQREMELKTNETENDWSGFTHFVDVVNNRPHPDSLLSVFNVKDFLKALSIDVLIFNWDSYYDHGRNFYIYQNPDDGRFHWIPWDYNLAFSSSRIDVLFDELEPGWDKPLIEQILAVDSFQTHYLDQYCRNFENNFTTTRLYALIDSTRDLIRTDLSFSTNEFFSLQDFDQNLNVDVSGGFGGMYRGLKTMINDRFAEVSTELTNLGHVCPPATALEELLTSGQELIVYPNPASEAVTFRLEQALDRQNIKGPVTVTLMDALGRQVDSYTDFQQEMTIPVSHLANGLYVWMISDGKRRSSGKMMVQR